MNNLAELDELDEDQLLETLINRRPDRRAELFGNVNPDLETKVMQIQTLDRKARRGETVCGIALIITIICLIAFVVTKQATVAIIGLFSFAIANWGGYINGKSVKKIAKLTAFYTPDKAVDDAFDKLEITERENTAEDKSEQALYHHLRLYLSFAYYCDQLDRVEIALDQSADIGVLANGLTKLQRLGMKDSDKYGNLEEKLKGELDTLIDNLRKTIKPFVMQTIMAIIKQDDLELLPPKVQTQFANSFADKLMDDTNNDDE